MDWEVFPGFPAWRALVEKYVRDGLDRKVLLSLLWNVLTVKLD